MTSISITSNSVAVRFPRPDTAYIAPTSSAAPHTPQTKVFIQNVRIYLYKVETAIATALEGKFREDELLPINFGLVASRIEKLMQRHKTALSEIELADTALLISKLSALEDQFCTISSPKEARIAEQTGTIRRVFQNGIVIEITQPPEPKTFDLL